MVPSSVVPGCGVWFRKKKTEAVYYPLPALPCHPCHTLAGAAWRGIRGDTGRSKTPPAPVVSRSFRRHPPRPAATPTLIYTPRCRCIGTPRIKCTACLPVFQQRFRAVTQCPERLEPPTGSPNRTNSQTARAKLQLLVIYIFYKLLIQHHL